MKKFIDGKITKEYRILCERERLAKYGYDKIDNCIEEAFNIMEYLKSLEGNVLFRVNIGTLEVIQLNEDSGNVDYDFKSLMTDINNYKVGTGYYWKSRLTKNDDRIGRRKLYETKKGQYFMDCGVRHYLNDYIEL